MIALNVIYHGYRRAVGGSFIAIETPAGEHIGVVRHLPLHSPTGLSWGYYGSGAADCARSLLIAALDDDAACRCCKGTGNVVLDPGSGKELPYELGKAATYNPELLFRCACEDGYRIGPSIYQAFKVAFVSQWGDEWRMPRSAILTWLAGQLGEA
ncbi:hypothetical protein GCM10009733_021260 [Nonomuraea maheshkhaliensis]|uniref:Uncharacterized protein n=1 Tax=Nonomuraea maheshkhaliensis TaxID=419590 RepID=A0ABP4QV91_9ACTN